MNDEVRKVKVFASYQLGTGPDAKMVGDESKNRFEVTFSPYSSKIMLEIEQQLEERHAEEVAKGLIPLVHHFQLISF